MSLFSSVIPSPVFAEYGTIVSCHCLHGGSISRLSAIWSRISSCLSFFILSILFAASMGFSSSSFRKL